MFCWSHSFKGWPSGRAELVARSTSANPCHNTLFQYPRFQQLISLLLSTQLCRRMPTLTLINLVRLSHAYFHGAPQDL